MMLTKGSLPSLAHRIVLQNYFRMGMLTDKLAEKQGRKAQEEFRK